MSNFPTFTPSHIAHIANAKSLDEATQMGFIDRIIDFFNKGVKREAIENIFKAISTMQRGTSYDADAGNNVSRLAFRSIDETERVELFLQLRDLALPEQRHQFQFDIYENGKGGFGTSITIAGERIYKNDDIYESVGDGQLPNLFITKLQLNLEDAIRTEDPIKMLKTLVDLNKFIAMNMPDTNDKGKTLNVDEREDIAFNKVVEILAKIPTETKAMIFARGTSSFGERVRGILDFGYQVIGQASSWPAPVSTPNIRDSGFTMYHMDPDTGPEILTLPAVLDKCYLSVLTACAEQLDAEQAPLSEVENNDPAVNDSNRNISKLEQLKIVEIGIHHELTEAEKHALNTIGIPDSVLRIM